MKRPERIAKSKLAILTGAFAIMLLSGVAPAIALAQAGGSPGAAPSTAVNSTPSGAPSPAGATKSVAPASSPASAASSAVTETPKSKPAAARPREHRQHKAARKTPNWVLQSKAQLALEADPRFKNVHATVTQPGVIVLEGDVFDKAAKSAAETTVAGVDGVKRVINALTTQSLNWLLVQNRINQALQQNGLVLVSVKVIGKTAFLSGQVSSAGDKDRAVSVVNSAAPDLTIGTNLIRVKASGL